MTDLPGVALGTMILVVGPSGAGKDTIIDGARARLGENGAFHFVRRDITRPAEAGGERHRPIGDAEFKARVAAGDYCLWWQAHGLGYGIPATVETLLAQGRTTIVNGSRQAIEVARQRFPRRRIILVTAATETLRRRLAARGRENGRNVEERLARAAAFNVAGPDVFRLANDGTVDEATTGFLALVGAAPGDREADSTGR
ncbi:phosphonate metabolism protein/1,5-bisphosphokinase (PRPP-forming) PhnN [Oceanibacterium hippocampi]|uniref:Ribose 1,5-bisphosphate phosphokinase PhnN n=1 Tax=Oceanibacterium hippocampi TaxID=745714 RepID=A0A1Y5TXS6_9PROT|nr:phosphonate metabolism protein/1,5-bisphosphokinase (PRPP-forming) PhnN [Oceanibacterium hippocampi]SLN76096.1 Ribose 1,5-bisphosphate phosphokinase PhnN [Oceanibacterium hippocampi]